MDLATIALSYQDLVKTTHSAHTTPYQWYGELQSACSACSWHSTQPRSCGHRSCNQCQNQSTTQWLERQQRKLLPVEYFMVTFTLPRQLRALTKANQRLVYALLFECAVATLKAFGLND